MDTVVSVGAIELPSSAATRRAGRLSHWMPHASRFPRARNPRSSKGPSLTGITEQTFRCEYSAMNRDWRAPIDHIGQKIRIPTDSVGEWFASAWRVLRARAHTSLSVSLRPRPIFLFKSLAISRHAITANSAATGSEARVCCFPLFPHFLCRRKRTRRFCGCVPF